MVNNICREDRLKNASSSHTGQAALLLVIALFMLSAVSYARNADWRNAIVIWEDAVKKSNNKARPHYNLGRLYRTEGRDREALGEYLAAARLDPGDPVTHYNAANTYLMLGRPDEAIAQYQSALSLRSDYADAKYNLDVAVRMLTDRGIVPGGKSGSVSAFNHNNAGNVYLRQGDLDSALSEYRAALKLKPDFAEAHYNLGRAYRSVGRDDDALREYRAALRCKPDDAMTHYNLGNLYYEQRLFDDAHREYAAALALKPDFGDARHNLHIVASIRNSGAN